MQHGTDVRAIQADLATLDGVDTFLRGKPRLGHGFLDQDFEDVQRVIETNITGTLYLIHKVGRVMLDIF